MDSLYNRIGAGCQKNENVFVVIKNGMHCG